MRPATLLLASAVLFATVSIPNAEAGERKLDPNAISDVKCTDKNTKFVQHNLNVAQLKICGGIAKQIQKCQGSPTSTTGEFEDVKFELEPVNSGATINVSKGRWEAGVFAGIAKCGPSPFTGVIPKGTSNGDLKVTLTTASGKGGNVDGNADDKKNDEGGKKKNGGKKKKNGRSKQN